MPADDDQLLVDSDMDYNSSEDDFENDFYRGGMTPDMEEEYY